MSPKRILYCAHSIRSDWNNGNAHFLRGLLRGLHALGHAVTAFEPADSWSYTHLLGEGERGQRSLAQFAAAYPELDVRTYTHTGELAAAAREADVVIVHEWSERSLIDEVLALRTRLGFRALFHDTHHRASSNPEQLRQLRVEEFDGVLAFGEALRTLYRERWGFHRVWTLHEAADISVFTPRTPQAVTRDLVWIGNWGDNERTEELEQYLLAPARLLPARDALIYGVRYPEQGLDALARSGVQYGGYLANLDAPEAFAGARCTVHVPRRQYASALPGIPTIRVFEALACGIPLISAPWRDTEQLFCPHDFAFAHTTEEVQALLRELVRDDGAREQRAAQGLATVRARHTTAHRAEQLSGILDEVLA